MMTKLLYTEGKGTFNEGTIDIPNISNEQIRVKAIYTGVCRSDIDMMQGNFGPLPLTMQGHEGLGKVIEKGKDVYDVDIGDFVATRGEPAYADFYNCEAGTYVKVPECDPKYIIEPVASGINIINSCKMPIERRGRKQGARLLIIGSGFLAQVVYHYLLNFMLEKNIHFIITVYGHSNKELWGEKLSDTIDGKFDVVIDLNNRNEAFEEEIFNTEALLIMGAEKPNKVTTTFSTMLWNSMTLKFPSPRDSGFIECMRKAVELIHSGKIDVSSFWTKGYDRNTEWKEAFNEGLNRPKGYSRGYIKW